LNFVDETRLPEHISHVFMITEITDQGEQRLEGHTTRPHWQVNPINISIPIEEPDPQAPLGAKGVGEPPCISVTPAIVAAIRDATGIDLKRTPVRPQDICL
jgi:hypothetical protein